MEANYGRRIKAARKYRNITQEGLAIKAGIKQSALSYIETGRNNTDNETALKIAEALNVTVDWIKGETDESDVPLENVNESSNSSDDGFAQRFIQVSTLLKSKGKFKNDAEFADKHNIPRATLSLSLSRKAKVNPDWVNILSDYGANKNYLLDGSLPALKYESDKNNLHYKQSVLGAINSIRKQLDMLEQYVIDSEHKNES